MEQEIWKDIDGFPGYQGSSTGFIRSSRDYHGNITDVYHNLKFDTDKDGYYTVELRTADGYPVSRRVNVWIGELFYGPHPGMIVAHLDNDIHNNNIKNLKFITAKQNSTDAAMMGLYKTKPVKIKETGEIFNSSKECSKALGVDNSSVTHHLSGRDPHVKDLHIEHATAEEYEKDNQGFLYNYQQEAVDRLKSGNILVGSVGSGKSRTSLYWYFKEHGGYITKHKYQPMTNPSDLYIITTAKKRDDMEWEGELANFLMSIKPEDNYYNNKIVVDSWQNIAKYVDVTDSYFIFDEDHLTGSGKWVKSFLKMAKHNKFIVVSATPGDSFSEYGPIFVANNFYRNLTEFRTEHIVYSRYSKYPKIDRYIGTERLYRLRERITVRMNYSNSKELYHEDIYVDYDIDKYRKVMKTRWNPYTDSPIETASEFCYTLRKVVNEHWSRCDALIRIMREHPTVIIFYSYDYELELLREHCEAEDIPYSELNGHKHESIPHGPTWVYLVNYAAGAEAWNCIRTDAMIFYSQTYSYKTMVQAAGRIDRVNSPYPALHYYHLKSRASIDLAISKALKEKKKFNETKFVKW